MGAVSAGGRRRRPAYGRAVTPGSQNHQAGLTDVLRVDLLRALTAGAGRASRCGSGGLWPRCSPADTGRRTRGSRPPGRQAREVLGQRRRDVLGHLLAGEVAEDGAPCELVHLAGPDAGPAGVLAAGGAGVAVVEHGADQHLRGDRRGAEVAGQQGDTGGEAAARAGAGDDDPGGVDAQLFAVFGDPEQSLVAVVDQGGAGGLGCQHPGRPRWLPGCTAVSNRVRSTYGRCLADTPVGTARRVLETVGVALAGRAGSCSEGSGRR